jgi:serine/threonine protein kinase/WD40 repeat protein
LAPPSESPAEGQGGDLDSIAPAQAELPERIAAAEHAAPDRLSEFRQTVVELGIMDEEVFDRTAAGFASDVEALVRSLSRSGLLTVYQAAAIAQGKARGLVVGDYLILDKIGQGGMGVVFKARHRRYGVTVALKVLPPRLARDRKLVLRFRREIHAAALLVHPNIVAALDAAEDRGVHFLTMEFIEGIDLAGFVKKGGALPVGQAVDYVIQAARGLEAAHARGIIHRDIKPANLMLDAMGTVRVLDLGLALLREDAARSAQTAAMTLTQAGTYMGTVDFMAPEQAQNSHRVDHRADIYSLGCTLHFLLTVRPPFEGATPISRLIAHQHMPVPSLRDKRPDVPPALDAVYQAMLAKRPEDRPGSMADLLSRLEACLSPAAQAPPGPPRFMTLPGPARDARVPSSPDAAAGTRLRDGSAVADVVRLSKLAESVAEIDVVEPVPSETACGLSMAQSSLPGAATPRRRLVLLSSVIACVPLIALLSLYAVYRHDREARALSDRVGTSLATNVAIEPAEEQTIAPDRQASEARENEGEPAPGNITPATTKDKRDGPAMVASSKSRPAPPEDGSRSAKKRPEPSPTQPPSVASTPPVATYEGTPRFRGHKGAVRTIAVSLDGKVALSTGADHYARLWIVETGEEIAPAKHHPSEILDAALSPDGRFAFTCTKGIEKKNGAVRLWNMRMPAPKSVFTSDRAHAGPVQAVALFRGLALSGGHDGQIALWNLDAHRCIGILGQQNGPIHPHAIAFFPHGVRAATGGQDRLVHIWNVQSRKEVKTWAGHQRGISSIAISADGRRVATASADGTVILWQTATDSPIRTFTMPDGDKNARVAILPDGNVLAAGSAIGHLMLWDANTGMVLRQAKEPLVKHFGLAVLPGRERVLTADQDGVVRLWVPRPR